MGVPMAFDSVVAVSLVNASSKVCSRFFFWCRHQNAPRLLRLTKWDINGQSGSGNIFRTERELIDEARAGRRPHGPTPDILFLEPVIINGRSVKWIDAKLYYASAKFASNTRVPNGKLQSQAQRYNHHFGGNGAFVFGQGFCSDLQRMVPGALLLDATPLDVSAVTAYQDAN